MLNSNAIAWSQFQLRRGWKNTAWFAGVYSALVLAAYISTASLNRRGMGMPSVWTNLLLSIQSAMLVLYATSCIATAIRTDVTSRMIESHRLMPLPASHAIYGYFLGGGGQAIVLAGCNFLIGLAVSINSGLDIGSWITSNLTLAIFALFIWTISALMAFTATRGKGGAGWIIGVVFLSASSQGTLLAFAPVLTVLCTPILGGSIFGGMSGLSQISETYTVSFLGQFALGALFYFACARRYREEGARGFTPLAALALLAVWAILSVYAIRHWNYIQPVFFRRSLNGEDGFLLPQVIVSTLLTMLIAGLPLGASVAFYRTWVIRRSLGGAGVPRRPIHPALVAIIAAGLCLLVCALSPIAPAELRENYFGEAFPLSNITLAVALTGASMLAFTFSMLSLMRITAKMKPSAFRLLFLLFALVAWAGPFIYEGIRGVMEEGRRFKWSWVGGISPIATLVNCWSNTDDIRANPLPGVIVQIMIAVALAMLFQLTRKKMPKPVAVADASPGS